jgi:hypothetical protein
MYEILNLLLDYDIYSKIYSLDTKHKDNVNIETYKIYCKYNDL